MGFGGEGGALSTEEREFIAEWERGMKEGEAKEAAQRKCNGYSR